MPPEHPSHHGVIRHAAAGVLLLLTLSYPFLWYFGREHVPLTLFAGVMAAVWLLRALLQKERRQKILSLLPVVFFAAVMLSRQAHAMYWYPVWVNALMLLLFGGSLLSRQSLIERLARLQQPDLPPEGVRYTRRVTQIWCAFFILNGSIAAYLIVREQFTAWALYTGVIAYVLMGLLFASEWLYRKRVLKV